MNSLGLIVLVCSILGYIFTAKYKREYLGLYVLFIFLFLPKISLIELNTVINIGIRTEDIIIFIFMLQILICNFCYIRKFIKTKIFYLYLAFIISSIISLFVGFYINIAISKLYSLLAVIRKIEYFCLIFVGFDIYYYNVKEKRKNIKETLFSILSIFLIITLILCILQRMLVVGCFIYGNYSPSASYERAIGVFNGPYELAQFFLMLIPIYFYLAIKNKKNRLINVVYIIACFIIILLSESRTCLALALLLIVLMCFVNLSKKSKIITLISTIVLAVSIVLLINFTNLSILDRFRALNLSTILDSIKFYWDTKDYNNFNLVLRGEASDLDFIYQYGDLSLNVRLFKWFSIIDLVIKYPIFGTGFGGIMVADGNYIKLLGENGIIGTALYMMTLIYIIVAKKHKSYEKSMLIWITISIMLGSVFIDIFDSSKIMEFYWLFVGLIYGEDLKINHNTKNIYSKDNSLYFSRKKLISKI